MYLFLQLGTDRPISKLLVVMFLSLYVNILDLKKVNKTETLSEE